MLRKWAKWKDEAGMVSRKASVLKLFINSGGGNMFLWLGV